MSSVKRIGIYSGAFDPVHEGHVQFALDAVRKGGLDRVFFLTEPRPRHKQGVKALEHRVAMVNLAIAPHPELGAIVLEQQRFTVHDTWPKLQARFDGAQLVMVMGNDVFRHLSHWSQLDQLTKDADFLVGLRGKPADEFAGHVAAIERARHVTIRAQMFTSVMSDVSSRKIRAQLKAGRQPKGLDDRVIAYITAHKLYADL